MLLTTIIDVALGLILLYLVLSLVCTTINEFISAFLKLRASNLASTIDQLIDDPTFRQTFYSHALIVSSALSSRSGAVKKLSDGVSADDLTTTQPVEKPLPSYLDGQTFARAVIDSLDPKKPVEAIGDIRASIEKLPENSVIRAALLANLSIANSSIDDFRLSVANWFDSSMDRLSGNYIRRLKLISLIVGFILAAALNADSLSVAKAIWLEHASAPEMQTQLSAAEQKILSEQTRLLASCENSDSAKQADCAAAKLPDLEDYLRPLPLGWSLALLPPAGADVWYWLLWVMQKVTGLAWTAVALSLGAPFWFDLLQKFMNLRGAGGKPASSTDPAPQPDKKVELAPGPARPPAAVVQGLAVTKEPT